MSAATGSPAIPRRVLIRGPWLRSVLAPIAFGVIFLGIWQLLVTALRVDSYIVPSPAAILGQFTGHR